MKKTFNCDICGIRVNSYNSLARFCSKRCKGIASSPKIPLSELARLYANGLTQEQIGAHFNVTRNVIIRIMKRNGMASRFGLTGSESHAWKGDDVAYEAFHCRVDRARGKPKLCADCGITNGRFEWANISGNYGDVNDYIRLCVRCHNQFDKKRRKALGHVTTIGVRMRKKHHRIYKSRSKVAARWMEKELSFKSLPIGTPYREACDKLGITSTTYYQWKKKFEQTK